MNVCALNQTGSKPTAIIIGGGIIGVTSALNLQKRGFSVTIIDKESIAAGATAGNCGLMAVSEIIPISKPGVLAQVPGWLMDSEGPVAIRPWHAIKMIPWLLRFLHSGKKENVIRIAQGLTSLSNCAHIAYEPLLRESAISNLLKPHEVIYLFDSKSDINHDQFSWDLRRDCGFDTEFLDYEKLHQLEPEISNTISCGMLMKGWDYFADPERLTKTLAQTFVDRGGIVSVDEVVSFNCSSGKIDSLLLSSTKCAFADEYVMATGAWSKKLASQLGDFVPVEAMAGYNTTINDPNVKIKHPLLYHNGGFVMTPMEMGLRVAGTLELGGLNSKPNYERMRAITRKAKRILPGLEVHEKTEWVGYRPMMPDTLPVIGRSMKVSNMTYACGHGQLGITYGAITGELVGQIVNKETTSVDLTPFRVDRF
jgi:D-amino-acid dehydrogenase